jgi:hypothetical protein
MRGEVIIMGNSRFLSARVLSIVGLLCFLPFFIPLSQHTAIPHGTEDRFTFGLPQSPWLVHSSTQTKEETEDGMSSSFSMHFSSSFKVEFIAWSWLFPITGMALIAVASRLNVKKAATA